MFFRGKNVKRAGSLEQNFNVYVINESLSTSHGEVITINQYQF